MANPSHFFEPIYDPGNDLFNRVQNAIKGAFDTLADQAARLIASSTTAAKTAVWSTVAVPFHDDMRRIAGDKDGVTGPRALIVAGNAAYFDGGQGVYAWDPTSAAADDNVNVIGKFTKPGRWRKV